MKKDRTILKIIIPLVIILSLVCVSTCSGQIAKDKVDHLLAGGLIGFSTSTFMVEQPAINSLALSVGNATVIGGCKELVWDKWMGYGTPEWADLGATVAGSVIGWGITMAFKGTILFVDKKNNYKGMTLGNTKIDNKYITYEYREFK